MNKQQLKEMLRPLVKELIREEILSSGIISTVISETVKGLGTRQVISEEVSDVPVQRTKRQPVDKQKLLESLGKEAFGGVDVFAGTESLTDSPGASVDLQAGSMAYSPSTAAKAADPLRDVDPNDAGIDLRIINRIAKKEVVKT